MKWIILGIAIAVVIFGIVPMFIMAYYLYRILLVRNKPTKWGRECPEPQDAEYKGMYDEGAAWEALYHDKKTEVSITSEGYHLVGEYFDFGGKAAVIIIAGRTESLLYSYYFAEPYRKAGYNVLVIDNRCHGESEGKYCSLGQKEYKDLREWSKLLHDVYHNEKIFMHGICIGSSGALHAFTKEGAPEYLVGMVAEGMYASFYESFKNNMKERNHGMFPIGYLVLMYIRLFGGVDVVKEGPFKEVTKMTKPILFLHSKEDRYSLPDKAEMLYNTCSSVQKKIVWFNCGAHSRIRANNKDLYDTTVYEFAKSVLNS